MHSRPLNQRPLWHRLLEWAGTLVLVGQAVWLGARIYGALDSRAGALSILFGILLGYLVADLLSGIAHWVGDRFFDPTTPVIGPSFIAPFREHHVTPQAMVEHGPIELVGNSALLALPKPKGGLRPIAIGEILRRLTGKCLCATVKEEAKAYFAPLQVGVACPLGVDAAVHGSRA